MGNDIQLCFIRPGRPVENEMEHKQYSPELIVQPEDVAALAIHALILPRSVEVTEISMRPLIKSQ